MIVDVPLPGLSGMPEMRRQGVTGAYLEREDYIRGQAQRLKDIKQLREQLRGINAMARPREPLREVAVVFRVGASGVGCVVEWRVLGVGGARILRRTAGALRLQPRTVRDVGPGVALLVLLRALERAVESEAATDD